MSRKVLLQMYLHESCRVSHITITNLKESYHNHELDFEAWGQITISRRVSHVTITNSTPRYWLLQNTVTFIGLFSKRDL